MNKLNKFLILVLISSLGFISFKATHAFFSDSASSTNNTFTAAAVFPTSTPSPTPTPNPIPSPTPGPEDVVINEINWAGSNGDGNDEWIELRNTTSNPINLAGWIVENLGTGSGPGADITISSGTIPADGFFLISNKGQTDSKVNVAPDITDTSVSLVNGGEQLVLKTNLTVTIDTANGVSAWFEGSNATPKKSMERTSPPGDGTVGSNWQTATTHTNMDGSGSTDEFGTPKAANGI